MEDLDAFLAVKWQNNKSDICYLGQLSLSVYLLLIPAGLDTYKLNNV